MRRRDRLGSILFDCGASAEERDLPGFALVAPGLVLRYSRHCFVWPTTSRTLRAVGEGLEAAWACFEGVPRYLVIDNFPAAVAGADPLNPCFRRDFLEYARHRGFITDRARARRPRDKPRVERSVLYVRERFFKGAAFRDLAEMRSAARRCCLEVAGQRIHGTTRRRPLEDLLHSKHPLPQRPRPPPPNMLGRCPGWITFRPTAVSTTVTGSPCER